MGEAGECHRGVQRVQYQQRAAACGKRQQEKEEPVPPFPPPHRARGGHGRPSPLSSASERQPQQVRAARRGGPANPDWPPSPSGSELKCWIDSPVYRVQAGVGCTVASSGITGGDSPRCALALLEEGGVRQASTSCRLPVSNREPAQQPVRGTRAPRACCSRVDPGGRAPTGPSAPERPPQHPPQAGDGYFRKAGLGVAVAVAEVGDRAAARTAPPSRRRTRVVSAGQGPPGVGTREGCSLAIDPGEGSRSGEGLDWAGLGGGGGSGRPKPPARPPPRPKHGSPLLPPPGPPRDTAGGDRRALDPPRATHPAAAFASGE
eukprot:scaffold357_cov400-Prasinococcus_capsulatus_cf.AAC.12